MALASPAVALLAAGTLFLQVGLTGAALHARDYARGVPCSTEAHALEEFARWDANGDGYVSLEEVEAIIAESLDMENLASFPELRVEVRAHFRQLDLNPPVGFICMDEFLEAAWVDCPDDACVCSGHAARNSTGVNATAARRALLVVNSTDNRDDVPGVGPIPGLWKAQEQLREDGYFRTRQMAVYNSNQLRALLRAWVERRVQPMLGSVNALGTAILEEVICGGVGQCSFAQWQIVNGMGGLFGSFISQTSAFVAKLVMYLTPSFSLVQTFQLTAKFDNDASVLDFYPFNDVPIAGEVDADSVFDIVAMLHVVPGGSALVNEFFARTVGIPFMPSVAIAQFSHDGGFDLDFSLAKVIPSLATGGLGAPGTPLFDIALLDQAVAATTAYDVLLEFDDANGNGLYDADSEAVGNSFRLGELAWEPITHVTSDGSCMSVTDFALLDLDTLRALCQLRALEYACYDAFVTADDLIAVLESNPIGCRINVDDPVILAMESRTKPIDAYPGFQFAVQFVTASAALENDLGTLIGPKRAKVSVEIKNFPFSLSGRRRLALRAAHAGANPQVSTGVSADLDDAFTEYIDSLGGVISGVIPPFPLLPFDPDTFPFAPGPPGTPGTGLLDGLPDLIAGIASGEEGAGAAEGDDGALSNFWDVPGASVVGLGSLAMTGSTFLQTATSSAAGAAALGAWAAWTARAAQALAEDPGLQSLADAATGGDVVALLLLQGDLPDLPEGAFKAVAYSSWVDFLFNEKDDTTFTSRTRATALGQAGVEVGSIAGLGAFFLARVNASASYQFVSFDTDSSYVLWDPALEVGEPMEWRRARAKASEAARAREPPAPPPGAGPSSSPPPAGGGDGGSGQAASGGDGGGLDRGDGSGGAGGGSSGAGHTPASDAHTVSNAVGEDERAGRRGLYYTLGAGLGAVLALGGLGLCCLAARRRRALETAGGKGGGDLALEATQFASSDNLAIGVTVREVPRAGFSRPYWLSSSEGTRAPAATTAHGTPELPHAQPPAEALHGAGGSGGGTWTTVETIWRTISGLKEVPGDTASSGDNGGRV